MIFSKGNAIRVIAIIAIFGVLYAGAGQNNYALIAGILITFGLLGSLE